jgi:hypothetical protein
MTGKPILKNLREREKKMYIRERVGSKEKYSFTIVNSQLQRMVKPRDYFFNLDTNAH